MKTLKKLMTLACFITIFACKADINKEIAEVVPSEIVKPIKKHYIQVALLLDTSNSMDGLIDQAKAQLWEIVNELSYAKCRNERPNLQIALYEYGNDRLAERDGYLRKILGFTEDLDEISKELFSLTTYGGSEYCGTVIKASLEKLDWQKNNDDLKMIFIAGNEPFNQGKVNYKDAALQAKEKNVVVNTIFCGEYLHGVNTYWKDGAQLAYGNYMAINQNAQTVHVPSPYDDIIIQLNIRLNGTYIPYGSYGKEKRIMQEVQDDNAAGFSKANAVSRTISKGSHLYKNATWDLVDAENEPDFKYSELKKEDLPHNLKDKSTTEIKEYVAKMRKEREEVQQEIMKLNEQRRKYLSENTKENRNGLESAMLQALRKQAEKKNYTWD